MWLSQGTQSSKQASIANKQNKTVLTILNVKHDFILMSFEKAGELKLCEKTTSSHIDFQRILKNDKVKRYSCLFVISRSIDHVFRRKKTKIFFPILFPVYYYTVQTYSSKQLANIYLVSLTTNEEERSG